MQVIQLQNVMNVDRMIRTGTGRWYDYLGQGVQFGLNMFVSAVGVSGAWNGISNLVGELNYSKMQKLAQEVSWDDIDGEPELTELLENIVGGRTTKLDYITSNGLELETTIGRTTTVLGTYKKDTEAILNELGNVKSLDFGPRDGGFNLLNTPDELFESADQFWNEYNRPWLDNVIARNDIIKIATEPTLENLARANKITGKLELSGFGREYLYLKQHGYIFNPITKTMIR